MQMRIIRGKVKPGRWTEYETAYKAVMKQIGAVPGLRARWLVRDTSDVDCGYSVSIWESEEALRSYEQSDILRDVVALALQPFFAGDFTTSHCDVVHVETFSENGARQ